MKNASKQKASKMSAILPTKQSRELSTAIYDDWKRKVSDINGCLSHTSSSDLEPYHAWNDSEACKWSQVVDEAKKRAGTSDAGLPCI